MSSRRSHWWMFAVLLLLIAASSNLALAAQRTAAVQIMVPGEDRFVPFAVTVHVGQKVKWVNQDTDSHYVVSNDAFNTAGHKGVSHLLPAGQTFSLTFRRVGVFPFYCLLHSMLDADNQPKAPGPDGGIQDPDGNFGTPMNGVVTVIP